jgi:hypothetical protein
LSIGALETHSSRKAMLLAVTVLGGTIWGASVPNFFIRFQALRLGMCEVGFFDNVFSIFFVHSTNRGAAQLITTGKVTFGCSEHCLLESVI